MSHFLFFIIGVCSLFAGIGAVAGDKVEKFYLAPYREISLIATPEGYYPAKITVFEGEKVHFFVTAIGPNPNCFIINEKNVFLSALSGKVSEGETYFEAPGMLTYRCPSTKIQGQLVILAKKKKVERSVASTQARGKVWRPKDAPDDWNDERGN